MQEAGDDDTSLVIDSVAFVGKTAVLAGARVMQGEGGEKPTELVRLRLILSAWMFKFRKASHDAHSS